MDFWHTAIPPIILLCALAGNLVLPYCWGWVWPSYSHLKNDTIILSDPDCPVRWIQRVWRLLLGCAAIFGGILFYQTLESQLYLSVVAMLAMIGYGAFGCIIPAVFSLTDIKYVDSIPAKIHNVCYLFGCICLQIAALCMPATSFEHGNTMLGAIFSIVALVAIFSFMIYNMSDRLELRDTIIEYEGIWEFAFHALTYVPIGLMALSVL